jgi:hypothetical protein
MRKIFIENKGIPLFIDAQADLAAKGEAATDSWYVKFNFKAGDNPSGTLRDREIGLEWHQMVVRVDPFTNINVVDFLFMDATHNLWLEHTDGGLADKKNGPTPGLCHVTSKFGTLDGNIKQLTLRLTANDGAVDVTMKPTKQVLYNGSVGLLPLLGDNNSYQFAFPNMEIEGTVRLNDETFAIQNATAWLDRQWTAPLNINAFPSWVWLGMSLNPEKTAVISLWDVIDTKTRKRYGFATLLDEQGVQSNHVAQVTYHQSWKSDRSGNNYPTAFTIVMPTADLELSLIAMVDRPESIKGMGAIQLQGCQSLCTVTGHYGSTQIDQTEIVAMVGDVCGEAL